MWEVVEEYDKRTGMEADLKGDKHGLALTVICKRRFPAQKEREISRLQQFSQIFCNTTVAGTPDSSTLVA